MIEYTRETFDVLEMTKSGAWWEGPFVVLDASGIEITDRITKLNRITGQATIQCQPLTIVGDEVVTETVTYSAPLRVFRKGT